MNKKSVIRFVVGVCLLALPGLTATHGQVTKSAMTPVEVARRIFDAKGFPALGKYITGEYKEDKGHPNGKDSRKSATFRFKLLSQTSRDAVVNLTIPNKSGSGTDYYLFFVKQGVWKMHAFRSLAMAGFGLFEKNYLERLSSRQVDSVIAASDPKTHGLFSSREEYSYKLGNARLLALSDDELIGYFNEHRHQFDELKKIIIAGKEELERNKTADIKLAIQNQKPVEENWKKDYKTLFITYVPASDMDFKNAVELVIWGMVDNLVGYVYIPDKQNVPMMSPDHIILLRAMGDGWFLYKTT
ncbi:hypothetical protein [Spirosoma rhododendri]|uniref:Uncharacterized protein n=1 Tax=Spirosoma rhododendri TaxID=2728024 RepID=A0A7L5DVP4_9BACT|nr:hypothetical protein [Spirosoma rhododendri]QJD80037.1 hypothetical protein HH216_17670 [Spirosoma rhododendri]